MYKPSHATSVSAYLLSAAARAQTDFIASVFDGEVVYLLEDTDGALRHCEIKVDDSIIMVGSTGGQMAPQTSYLHVYVPNVDDTFARGLAAGGEAIVAPEQRPGEDDKRGGFKDPWGNSWWIATHQK